MFSLLLALNLNATPVNVEPLPNPEPIHRGVGRREKGEKYVPPNNGGPDSKNGTGTRINKPQK